MCCWTYSQMSEDDRKEMIRRADLLLQREGEVFKAIDRGADVDQWEMIITGWSPHPLVLERLGGEVSIHYDSPRPVMVVSNDDHIQQCLDTEGNSSAEIESLVLDALRRYMLLDDLADV